MPRNTTGGNKNKKKANKHVNEFLNRKLELPDGKEQDIALCIKILGSSRFKIKYVDSLKNEMVECIGIARKNLRRSRQFVSIDNYMIITKRDYQKDVVDIIHVYNDSEVNSLKNMDSIHEYLINGKDEGDNLDFKDDYIISDEEELEIQN